MSLEAWKGLRRVAIVIAIVCLLFIGSAPASSSPVAQSLVGLAIVWAGVFLALLVRRKMRSSTSTGSAS
jgi:hypothetical protein